jgi:hypothetical protein
LNKLAKSAPRTGSPPEAGNAGVLLGAVTGLAAREIEGESIGRSSRWRGSHKRNKASAQSGAFRRWAVNLRSTSPVISKNRDRSTLATTWVLAGLSVMHGTDFADFPFIPGVKAPDPPQDTNFYR